VGAGLPETEHDIRIPSGQREVAIGTVSAGETWSFAATGRWTNGWIACGPDGYRNFLFDALQIEPRARGEAWFRLIGEIKGRPGSTFAIGPGCTRTFHESGELVVFANDSADGYSNNTGDPPGSAIGSFAVVRLFCGAKASMHPSLAQDESSFGALHKKEVASIAILAGADAVSDKLADSTISAGSRQFTAT
jgi:hypothetical protein